MTLTNDRYINLFTDFGFKKLFGETPHKELLIAFLNELLQGKEKIEDLSYLKNERLGNNEVERRAVYDLYCTNEKGEKIIIEIQRVKQEFFKDRSVYYSSFAVQDQAIKGKDWNRGVGHIMNKDQYLAVVERQPIDLMKIQLLWPIIDLQQILHLPMQVDYLAV